MSTQLRDYHGNPIDPTISGDGASVQASKVSVAAGTGLNSSTVQAALGELNEKIDSSDGGSGEGSIFEIATGNKDESCVIDDASVAYVNSIALPYKKTIPSTNEDIVLMSHDDLPESDYVGTRKIHNKYGFTATYNYILNPFSSESRKRIMTTNVKRQIADGHEIGLHAIFGASFFWRNLLYDVTPDSSATFAPSLSEMNTVVADGKNIFDISIDANSTFSTVKHAGNTSISSVKIATATNTQWFSAVSFYTTYFCPLTASGLDMNNNVVTKTFLGWLEYWYNELIDNTLGYSTYTGTAAERFAADYSGTYPNAEHILSGNLSEYGAFTKGLFKGCHSCCNFEVVDRVIAVAEAFCRRFFGLPYFTNMAYHGGYYANLFYTGPDGALYSDRDCTVLGTGQTKLYLSLKDRWMNLFDIALAHGIKINKRHHPIDPARVEGEIGLYKGQKNIRGPYFTGISHSSFNSYLALVGTTRSSSGMNDNISYQQILACMPDNYADWSKFAYEHAGQDISGNGSIYMLSYYKQIIDLIREAVGTGKVTTIGTDTIGKNPSVMIATELVCQYCYKHNIRICTSTEALNICNNDRIANGNVFPNPSFRQTLLEDFGGSSTQKDAYLPDGFYSAGDAEINVTKEDGNRVLTMQNATVMTRMHTRVYGLPSGRYRFTAMMKSTNPGNCVAIAVKLNSEKTADEPSNIVYKAAGSTFEEITYEFEIPEPHKNTSDGTYANTMCDGYEDNVAYVRITFIADVNKTTSIYNPRIDKV